jgi:hypothetical protein
LDYQDPPNDLEIRAEVEIVRHRRVNLKDDASQEVELIVMENQRRHAFALVLARVLTNLFRWEIFE